MIYFCHIMNKKCSYIWKCYFGLLLVTSVYHSLIILEYILVMAWLQKIIASHFFTHFEFVCKGKDAHCPMNVSKNRKIQPKIAVAHYMWHFTVYIYSFSKSKNSFKRNNNSKLLEFSVTVKILYLKISVYTRIKIEKNLFDFTVYE